MTAAACTLAIAFAASARAVEHPLAFVENFGQADARAELVARTRSGAAFVTREGVVLDMRGPSGSGAALRMRVVGGAPTCVEAEGELPSHVSYFRGADPLQWKRGLRTWSSARQRDVYPGIDLVYHGSEGALEHDFIVAPGADPAWIRVAWEGAQSVTAQPDGSLHIDTGRGVLVQKVPVAWEERGGVRRDVKVRQVVDARGEVGYEVGKRDPGATLVIDPLVYSTYLGGRNHERAYDVRLDAAGNAFVAGYTSSDDFPVTFGAYDSTLDPTEDVFLAKFDAFGALSWATYLSGADFSPGGTIDGAIGIDIDGAGNVSACGTAGSGFPVTPGAYDRTFNGGSQTDIDAFVARISADGSSLLFGTYLGGSRQERCSGLTLDESGDIVVVGATQSPDFPTTFGVADGSLGGSQDLFVTKLDSAGSRLRFSTYVGGSDIEQWFEAGSNVVIDSAGNVYFTAETSSRDYPTTPGAYDRTLATAPDAVVTKLSADGRSYAYSTYLGGRGTDHGQGIAVNSAAETFVTGLTGSRDFPVTRGAYQTRHGDQGMGSDAFVTRLNASGSALVYSTFLGGRREDQGFGIVLDATGQALVTGETQGGIQTSPDAFDSTINGTEDAFVSRLNAAGSALTYSTYLGGASHDQGMRLELESASRVVVVGYTASSDFPTASAFDPTLGGLYDAFVTKLDF